MEKYVIESYKKALNNVKIVSAEEESALYHKAKAGDICARNKLIESSLKTVWQIAQKYTTKDADLFDLIQEGNEGLFHAFDLYRLDSGYRFNTYAVYWIRKYIQKYYHEKVKAIRYPVNKEILYHKIKIFREKYSSENGKAPDIAIIAKEIGKSTSFVSKLLSDMEPCISFDFSDPESEVSLLQLYGDTRYNPEVQSSQEDNSILMKQAIEALPVREREVIKLRFGLYDKEYTLNEVAEKMGITPEGCRKIQLRALEKMKKFYKGRGIENI